MSTSMSHSGNPALGDRFEAAYRGATTPAPMTVFGTALRTAFLLVILVAGGAWGWASATGSTGSDLGGVRDDAAPTGAAGPQPLITEGV